MKDITQPKTLRVLLAEAEARDRVSIPQGASDSEVIQVTGDAGTPACAHLEVAWNQESVHDDDGYYLHHTGWWACVACGTRFTVARALSDLLSPEFLGQAMEEIETGGHAPWKSISEESKAMWLEDGARLRERILGRVRGER